MQRTAANDIVIAIVWSCPRFGSPALDLHTSKNRINQRETINRPFHLPLCDSDMASCGAATGNTPQRKVQHVNSIESRRCYQHLLSKSLPKPTPVQTTRTADSTVLTCRLKTMTKCMQKPAVLKLSFHRDGVYKLICTLAASLGENPFHSLFMMHDYVSETSDKANTCKGNLASW